MLSKEVPKLDTYISRNPNEKERGVMRVPPLPRMSGYLRGNSPPINPYGRKRASSKIFGILKLMIFGKRKKDKISPGRVVPVVPPVKMEAGLSYLLPSEKPDNAFRILTRELRKGASGLIITRLHPEEVKSRFNIGSSPVHWLSRAFTKESMSPTNLGGLADEIAIFVEKEKEPVVLLDGVEYLIIQNDLQKVVKFISTVRDCIAMHKARMLIPFNLQSVDESGRALLTRDLHIIEWNG